MHTAVPEYMKIRTHLINLINVADSKNSLIPPENELCRLFGVTRPTVRNAIKGLVLDGYLIPRKGLGTFINLDMAGKDIKRIPNIGLMLGDGQVARGGFDPVVAQCLIGSGTSFEPLYIPESRSVDSLAEIARAGIDAVIWCSPNEQVGRYIEALKNIGTPILCIDIEKDAPAFNCDFIHSNRAIRGVKLAEYLYSKGHRNMLFVHNYPQNFFKKMTIGSGSTHDGYCKRMDELCGSEPHETGILSLLEFERMAYQRDISLKRFSVIYSLAFLAPYLAESLRLARLSVPDDMSCMFYGMPTAKVFRGIRMDHLDKDNALFNAVNEWIDLRLFKRDMQVPFIRNAAVEIVAGESVANLANTFISLEVLQ